MIPEIGQKFKFLEFIESRGKNKHGAQQGLFRCECGTEKVMLINNVVIGKSSSCGCYRKKFVSETKPGKKHGFAKTPLFDVWHLMRRRCYKVGSKNYHQYGALGIKMCDEWKDNAGAFVEWAKANGYKKGLQIDRIDTYGNYEPSNCRFVTSKVNNNNRKDNKLVEFNGQVKTLQEWADEWKIDRSFIRYCLRKGWPIEKVFMK